MANNAGIQHRQPLTDVHLADWQRVIDTNLTGAFLVGRTVARRMLRRRAGKIVNICSVAGRTCAPDHRPLHSSEGCVTQPDASHDR
ncbi:SDR family NAD(P)-dependent oxidoreductase [Prauserella alba]|uniref:SDR family NAD(P)-dependent oxidoreductase n=1 Tax=Prauserella alba TaxID=176898 RepID=UPI0020A5A894|nr:SDR family NAD(P)-dependent oxidoreductase [Prauserella alba]